MTYVPQPIPFYSFKVNSNLDASSTCEDNCERIYLETKNNSIVLSLDELKKIIEWINIISRKEN